jgi:integrase
MASAWVFQDKHMVKKHGAEKASWYAGWLDPDGHRCCKSCGPGSWGKIKAEKLKKKIEAELTTGTYQLQTKKLWADFRREYEAKILSGKAVSTRNQVRAALDHFERLVKPVRVSAIHTSHVDDFIARRRTEPGKKKGSIVSPFTTNKDLRIVKAAVAVAKEWGYLEKMPRFRMEREPGKLPVYITPEHFVAVYQACDKARKPTDLANGVTAGDWWRALLVLGYFSGWRINDMLSLRKDRLDLDKAEAVSRAEDNKAKRAERIDLHPLVVEHLRRLQGSTFSPVVFSWTLSERTLYIQFAKIQEEAGIHLACDCTHRHTRFCHVYGFHALRRAFATMNADRLSASQLQTLMRHKSYATTLKYINMARAMREAVSQLYVPEGLDREVVG